MKIKMGGIMKRILEVTLSVVLSVLLVWGITYALDLERVKTWTTEILTHTDLNAEFDNILDHDITNADVSATAAIAGSKITPTFAADTSPSADGTYDLGTSSAEWQDIYIDGVAYIDAVGEYLASDTDSTDDLGTTSIYWDDAYIDAIHTDTIGTNTLLVGTGGKDYTTISLALAAAAAGDTILVAEGTYTEAITFADDNVALRALGRAENTIITQAAANVVNMSTKSGCTIDGFTVRISAADGADFCIISANDSTSDYNIIENCILDWGSATAATDTAAISHTDGNLILRNCRITMDQTATGASGCMGIYAPNVSNHTWQIYNNTIIINNATTSGVGNIEAALNIGGTTGTTAYVYNNICTVNATASTTSHDDYIIYINTATSYIMNNVLSGTATSSGKMGGVKIGTTGYVIGNIIQSSTGDSDGVWLQGGTTSYVSGNIVTGDANYTTATTAYESGNQILETCIFGDGNNIATATEVDAFFYNGIAIGTDNDNNILDDATHGSGVGTLYLGNATVDATFTGFHYYQLGDTNLKAGELVCLKDGKIYRSTIEQDPTAIGLYTGLQNWKDSLGNELIDGEEIDETYYDEIEKKEKIRKKKDYGKSVNKLTNKKAKASDYSYSVAVVGDSRHENETNPLLGAYVTIDAGVIKNGDYLCSSSKAGYLEKQATNAMMNYTIGKAREDINADKKDAYIYLLQ